MKKIIALLLAIMMLCGITAFAEEAAVDEADRNYAPESGTGWMSVDIHGEHEELTYVESVRSLSGTANSHFPRPAGPHFPASQGHIKRSALEIGRARGAPPC